MDQIGNQNIKTLSHKFIRSQFLKKLAQLLLSVSVFSLFFSHTSLLSFLNSYDFYFSTFPFQLFTHTIDKNYIFLLCNGLLVFVAKYSGLINSSSSKYNLSHDHEAFNGDLSRSESVTLMESKVPLLEKEFVVESNDGTVVLENAAVMERTEHEYYMIGEEEEKELETEKIIVEDDQEQEGESGFSITNKEEEEENGVLVDEQYEGDIIKEAESSGFSVEELDAKEEEEEEVELEEGNGMLSTEELNKKFDDFIRKMKEELRIEAQHQLVMV